jgi:hypothetical protein
VFPVKYELVIYIPEEAILHSLRREIQKSYVVLERFRQERHVSTEVPVANLPRA